jgi:mannose-6-phosphate isomerase
MYEMRGAVRHYEWGSPTAIPALLGMPQDGSPWAEVWFGDLPSAPSSVKTQAGWTEQNGGRLPYLAKLLAAEAPLSLQTHPTAEAAALGFERENAAGIPVDGPRRIYRDASAKPEILVALTPFAALCGFRPLTRTIDLLDAIGAQELSETLATDGLRATFESIMRSPADGSVVAACISAVGIAEAAWATRLAALYPGDPAAVAALLLNFLELRPGEAIYLAAGNIHAYLHGVGLEVMGPSDNVVRCGLTPKHVDIDEMMATVDFRPLDEPRVPIVDGLFATPGAPFVVNGGAAGSALPTNEAPSFESWFIPPDRMQFVIEGAVYTVSPSSDTR